MSKLKCLNPHGECSEKLPLMEYYDDNDTEGMFVCPNCGMVFPAKDVIKHNVLRPMMEYCHKQVWKFENNNNVITIRSIENSSTSTMSELIIIINLNNYTYSAFSEITYLGIRGEIVHKAIGTVTLDKSFVRMLNDAFETLSEIRGKK